MVQDDSITSNANASKRAQTEAAWRSHLEDIDSFVVRQHKNAPLGAAQVGDTIIVEGPGDWADVSITCRILTITYQPENGQVAEYGVARTDKLDTYGRPLD